jgi:hypothetical protein
MEFHSDDRSKVVLMESPPHATDWILDEVALLLIGRTDPNLSDIIRF